MAWTEFVNGTTADADEVNANFDLVKDNVIDIYEGDGFDTSGAEDTHELTAITIAQMATVQTYVKLSISTYTSASAGDDHYCTAQLRIQVKETGGAYADVYGGYQYIVHSAGGGAFAGTINYYHTPTAGEIANGMQFKISAKSSNTDTGNTTVRNRQTVTQLL